MGHREIGTDDERGTSAASECSGIHPVAWPTRVPEDRLAGGLSGRRARDWPNLQKPRFGRIQQRLSPSRYASAAPRPCSLHRLRLWLRSKVHVARAVAASACTRPRVPAAASVRAMGLRRRISQRRRIWHGYSHRYSADLRV